MSEDDDYCEEVDTDVEPAMDGRKLRWIDALLVAVQVVEGMAGSVVTGIGDMKMLLAMHASYQFNREAFAAEAGRELETLMSSNEDSDLLSSNQDAKG